MICAEKVDIYTQIMLNWEAFKIYFHTMLENGVYLPPSQFETNFVSLQHGPEEIEKTLAAAEKAFAAIAETRK